MSHQPRFSRNDRQGPSPLYVRRAIAPAAFTGLPTEMRTDAARHQCSNLGGGTDATVEPLSCTAADRTDVPPTVVAHVSVKPGTRSFR